MSDPLLHAISRVTSETIVKIHKNTHGANVKEDIGVDVREDVGDDVGEKVGENVGLGGDERLVF